MWISDGGQPGAEDEQPAEMPHTAAPGGGWARDKNDAVGLFYSVKKT